MAPSNSRILVIDDEPSIHKDFRSILAAARESAHLSELESTLFGETRVSKRPVFDIDSALQGQEGVLMAREALDLGRPYCVAFVDMRMPPGWDGLRTVKELWAADPRLQVIICTAYTDHSWAEVLGEIGTSDRLLVIRKPFDPIEVTTAATALSTKWKLARETEATIERLERLLAQERSSRRDPPGGGMGGFTPAAA